MEHTDQVSVCSLSTIGWSPIAACPSYFLRWELTSATTLCSLPKSGTLVFAVHGQVHIPQSPCQFAELQDEALIYSAVTLALVSSCDIFRFPQHAPAVDKCDSWSATNTAIEAGSSMYQRGTYVLIDHSCHLEDFFPVRWDTTSWMQVPNSFSASADPRLEWSRFPALLRIDWLLGQDRLACSSMSWYRAEARLFRELTNPHADRIRDGVPVLRVHGFQGATEPCMLYNHNSNPSWNILDWWLIDV
jgi:hypothetical protein